MTDDNMTREEARAFLTRDGGRVPCSRYGTHSEDCWPFAYALAEIAREANGDAITRDALDYYMGLVVNDHDGVASLIRKHGTAEHRAMLAEVIPNQYPAELIPDLFGGQVLIAWMDDGGVLCERCVRDESNPVHPADGSDDGWGIVEWDGSSNHEDYLTCDHCGRVLVEVDQS